jgi:hypothetical protein
MQRARDPLGDLPRYCAERHKRPAAWGNLSRNLELRSVCHWGNSTNSAFQHGRAVWRFDGRFFDVIYSLLTISMSSSRDLDCRESTGFVPMATNASPNGCWCRRGQTPVLNGTGRRSCTG